MAKNKGAPLRFCCFIEGIHGNFILNRIHDLALLSFDIASELLLKGLGEFCKRNGGCFGVSMAIWCLQSSKASILPRQNALFLARCLNPNHSVGTEFIVLLPWNEFRLFC